MKKITLGLLLFCSSLYAQLQVDNLTQSPAQLVQNVLIGQGVTPTNIKYNGSLVSATVVSDQVAHFTTNFNPTNLGVNEGLLMATGNAKVALGPNNLGGAQMATTSVLEGDADLALLSGKTIHKVCIIEFDFVATGLELNFDYVFASEEYPEWVNTLYNDTFGFFLSGPGISGIYSNNAKNIALVPNTNTPISVDNVNAGSNSQYFVNNGTGSTPAVNSSIQYDGFTTLLRATSQLQCGQTYHIKLAIAQASDSNLDSAVFLKNFRIKPMELLDTELNAQNTQVCYGKDWTIDSGLPAQPNYLFVWTKDGVVITDVNGVPVNTPTLTLGPATAPPLPDYPFGLSTTPATYALTVYVMYPTYNCQIAYDDIILAYLPQIPVTVTVPITDIQCTNVPPPYNLDLMVQAENIIGTSNRPNYKVSYYSTNTNDEAENGGTAGLLFSEDLPGSWTYTLTDQNIHEIWIRIEDLITGCVRVESVKMGRVLAPSGSFSYPGNPYLDTINTPQLPISTVTSGGTYSATPAGLELDPVTGSIIPSLSTIGTYAVTYNLAASTTCPAFASGPVMVTIFPAPAPPLTNPITYCQGETAVPLTATGSNLLWYAVPSGGVGSATAPTPSTINSGNTTYYVSQTAGGLESARTPLVVTVNPSPAAPTVTPPADYCQNDVASPLNATGTALLWYTTATGGTGSAAVPTPNTASGGTTTYYVTQTVAGCESTRSSIAVVVHPTPAAPTVISPIGYCQNGVAAPLTATGSNLLWYQNATGGVGNPIAPVINTAAMGSNIYYVSQTINGCEGPRTSITVNVTATLPAPLVSSPITYCQGGVSAPLTATGSGLLWYTSATGGTGSATAPTPSTAIPGSTTYYVSQAAGCEGPRAAIVVDVLPSPSAPTVASPVTYCQNAAAVALTATGVNLKWYTVSTGGVGNATAPTPSTATAGTTTYYVSQTVNGCEGIRTAIDIIIYATPALPTVTTPIGYCQDSAASALTATGSNLLWYTTATGGTGSASSPTPSTATSGSTTYYVSQTINGCEGPRAAIVVNVTPTPAPPTVTSTITYCQNATATALTATGSNLLWYIDPLNGLGSATAPVPSTTASGTTSYYVSQTVNSCESTRAIIIVDVLPTPTAPIVSAVTYCQNASAVALTAIGSGLKWYTTATGGTATATAPTPNTASAGTTNYYVSQTVNGCEGPRALIAVTIYGTPLLPTVTTPVGYCQNSVANPLIATGANLLWYTVAAGGTGSSVSPTPLTAMSGSTTYYVSQTINGCEGPRAAIVVNITPTPAAPTVTSPITYCQNTTATALTATGNNLLWYAVSSGGAGNVSAPIPTTAAPGTISYYVSQTVNGCEGPRALIAVDVLPAPAAPTVSAVSYCQNTPSVALTATGSGLKWYTTAVGGTGNSTAPTPTTISAGITNYYVSQTVNGCEGPRALIAVTVYGTPLLPSVTSPIGYCQNSTASSLTAIGSNLLWYTTATGGTANSSSPTPSTTASGSTTYYVSQTINGCEGPRAAIVVNVTPTPVAPAVASPKTYCQNVSAPQLTATGSNLLWYASSTGGTGSTTAPTPNTSSAGSITYYVSQSTNGCESPRATIVVDVLALPNAPAVSPLTYCQNEAATALTATGSSLLWYTNATGGTGNSIAPVPGTAAAGVKTYYVSQTVNGCEGPRAGLTVTVFATPSLPTVVSPVSYCQNASANQLSGIGNGLLWYTTPTGGTASVTAPIPTTAIAGSISYYVSQTINGCEGPRSAIVVNVNPTPGAPSVTSPVTYCQDANATALTATGANLLWYTGQTSGTGNSAAPVPGTGNIGSTTYYVSQTTNSCESPRAAITVIVNELPSPTLVNGTLCLDETNTVTGPYVLDSGLSNSSYTFEWFIANGTSYVPIALANQNTYSAYAAGIYGVQATNVATGCESGLVTATVSELPTPQLINVVASEYFADDQRITIDVFPQGNYHYQLDNGALQSSNVFIDVPPGLHTVLVKSECGEYNKEVFLMDYPKYFTPNGDGYNDTWNIFSLSSQAKAKIYIFDRFGKLLKEISPSGAGWDGKYNQQNLPSTDYWFIVHYEENNVSKEFKSHFALKR